MAGIGFELKRIFKGGSLISQIRGVVYASFVSIGPSLVFLLLLVIIRAIMSLQNATEYQSLFFTAAFTNAFLVAFLVSGLMNTVVSRYISDKIFLGQEGDISSCMFGVFIMTGVIAGLIAVIQCLLMYATKEVSPVFIAAYYVTVQLAAIVYNAITFISVLKEYKNVTLAYLIGTVLTICALLCFHSFGSLDVLAAVFVSLIIGFLWIALHLISVCIRSFGPPNHRYFEVCKYFSRYPALVISGAAYTLGFYVSNIIYRYSSELGMKVNIFRMAPNYDMAFFGAILINLSSLVLFEIKTETVFYDGYVEYLSALESGGYAKTEEKRRELEHTIGRQLFLLYEVQLIVTVTLICITNIVYPYLGVSNQILNMLLVLGLGVYCTLCMNFTIIFLYYFGDYKSSLIVLAVFLGIVVSGSLCCAWVIEAYYALPLLTGALCGWGVSFILLKRRLKTLNKFLLCR